MTASTPSLFEDVQDQPVVVVWHKKNATDAQITFENADIDTQNQIVTVLYNDFSFIDESLKHTTKYKWGQMDCYVRFFNRKTKTIAIGLVQRATESIREKMPDIKFRMDKDLLELFKPPHGKVSLEKLTEFATALDIRNAETGETIMPYDHQMRLVDEGVNKRRASLMACTSAGKSLSMYILTRWFVEKENKKVLVIVPSSGLVEQLYSDYKNDYGWTDIKKHAMRFHGESKDKLSKKSIEKLKELDLGEEAALKDVTISTWQSLQNKEESFFLPFGAVLVDEAHGMRGAVIRDIVNKCVHAQDVRLGFSGTLPESGLEAALIEGCLGKRIEVVRLCQLVELGLITPVEIRAMRIPYKESIRRQIKRMNYQDETTVITNNSTRFDLIELLMSSKQISTEQNTIILYRQLNHLDKMLEYLKEHHPEYTYHVIKGEVAASTRNEIRGLMEQSTGNILIGTYQTLQQGINIRRLNNLIMAESSKSMYMVMQSIGRTVRKHPDKQLAVVYDMFDDASYESKPRSGYGRGTLQKNYSLMHYETRTKYYKDDRIPVNEFDLTGYVEGDIDMDQLILKQSVPKKPKKPAKKKTRKF